MATLGGAPGSRAVTLLEPEMTRGTVDAIVLSRLGSASARRGQGFVVGALAAVNAVGSALIGDGPHFWAAPYERAAEATPCSRRRPAAPARVETRRC